jgi:hypothetical protein
MGELAAASELTDRSVSTGPFAFLRQLLNLLLAPPAKGMRYREPVPRTVTGIDSPPLMSSLPITGCLGIDMDRHRQPHRRLGGFLHDDDNGLAGLIDLIGFGFEH